eukprot:4664007-Amphidinium_carterae.2
MRVMGSPDRPRQRPNALQSDFAKCKFRTTCEILVGSDLPESHVELPRVFSLLQRFPKLSVAWIRR